MRIRGVVVREAGGTPELEELELAAPGPGEVLVRILASGVCRSDQHAIDGFLGSRFPYVLGHEASGIVEMVGEGVTSPIPGDAVALSWRAACGTCDRCRAGRTALCRAPVSATSRFQTLDGITCGRVLELGTFATHTVVAAAQAVPIPGDLDPRAMALVGCGVATGVGAATVAAGVTPGSSVAVFGCGAVGLSAIQGARIAGAAIIVGVDVEPRKLAWAEEVGATHTILAGDGTVARIREICDGRGADFALDAVGVPATLADAIACGDNAGVVVIIGVPVPKSKLELDIAGFFWGRRTLRATWYGDMVPERDFATLADHYRTGALNLDRMVTQVLPLDRFAEALGAMERGEVIRTVLVP